MEYWLAVSNRENAEIAKKHNVWGVSKRFINQISRAKPGDRLLIYVRNKIVDKDTVLPPAIVGAFEIVSAVREDSTRIFEPLPHQPNEIFPLRISLKPVKIFNPPVEFKTLVSKLKFITNKKQWVGHIRGQAMRTIPEEDCLLIMKAAGV